MRYITICSAVLASMAAIAILCDHATLAHQAQKKETLLITGVIDCKDKGEFDADTIVTVELRDTSLADAKAVTIAKQTIKDLKKFPIPFEIAYDPAAIQAKNTYSLSVRITTKERLDYINDTQIAVITRNAPTIDVKAMVIRVMKNK
ncbi:MAG TPA: YbaY family lipoprotein [Gemmataceae bacterium]|nr:YbaY family lipoprotein [Gemmataceae bacterium]